MSYRHVRALSRDNDNPDGQVDDAVVQAMDYRHVDPGIDAMSIVHVIGSSFA